MIEIASRNGVSGLELILYFGYFLPSGDTTIRVIPQGGQETEDRRKGFTLTVAFYWGFWQERSGGAGNSLGLAS